ncbi:neuromedin Bb [Brachionichthys hirsutus]|uniref:neuromedin Bb n=1 Tax=Brachionichthys hirsutus TaxID=412623 RepID=UPI0036044E67
MGGFTLRNACHCGLLTAFVFLSFLPFTAAVSFDLTELRNKVAKIKLNPRGNLWATGHLMGKKSVMDDPLLPSAEGQDGDALEVNAPSEQSALVELIQEFVRGALQAQEDTQERRPAHQETNLLMKILDSYFQNTKC